MTRSIGLDFFKKSVTISLMSEILPLFKTHYSLGKSILNLSVAENQPDESDSIFSILKRNEMNELILVEDCMSGFLEAYKNSNESNIKLVFGLRLTVCQDMQDKSPESLKTNSKVVLFLKNNEGYKKLIKIFSLAARKGFYYEPRIDYKTLKEVWNEQDLMMVIPFYDSYIFKNTLENNICVPEFDFVDPTYFLEDNDLPFDSLIKRKVINISNNTQRTQSVYYRSKKDFKAYLTFRCINKRSTLDKPELDHMTSDEFCVEGWKEKNG
jgi:DNA polymerase-3 subunit alpha